MSDPQGYVVLCTVPNEAEGARIARALVEERLAACVNVLPGVRSFYRWEGQVQDDPELLLVIKTTPARRDELIARIPALHPYSCPEAIALPIPAGSAPYLRWLAEVTS